MLKLENIIKELGDEGVSASITGNKETEFNILISEIKEGKTVEDVSISLYGLLSKTFGVGSIEVLSKEGLMPLIFRYYIQKEIPKKTTPVVTPGCSGRSRAYNP